MSSSGGARRSSSGAVSRNSRNILLSSNSVGVTSNRLTLPSNSVISQRNGTNLQQARPRLQRFHSDGVGDGPPRLYLIGTRIEAKITGWMRYYPGRVAAVNSDGTLMIRFDDGDLRDCVQLVDVYFESRSSSSASPQKIPLEVGNQVEFFHEQRWVVARIVDVYSDNERYSILLADQRILREIPRDLLRVYKPNLNHVVADEELEFLNFDRTWTKGTVDESLKRLRYTPNGSSTTVTVEMDELELRYPILNPPPRQPVDDDSLDATPMILSMQERLSQGIDVGSQILITDKNGGALPKTGKADSAQVSIINFPLPADAVVESITLRLFEPPAEEATVLEVILFDREQAPMTRTHRLSSAESSNDEGGNSPPLSASGSNAADIQVARFYVAPDLPYRPSRAQISVNPHSRGVQTSKLSVPLRGSAGQYLGLMNRFGRLNIAYTPDKKKPGESWTEKSVEVFYMMPRMVPKPFIGGPHSTRDWHGRAGWYAVLVVSDPVDAVDPGWQRRCTVDALNRRSGHSDLIKLCWLITTMARSGEIDPTYVLFQSPQLINALRRLSEVDDAVVELMTQICSVALTSSELRIQTPNSIRALIRLHKALRFKAWEMQAVQRGRLLSNTASFQSLLRCSLLLKRILAQVSPPILSGLAQQTRYVKVTLQPRGVDAAPSIYYHVNEQGRLFVSRSEIQELGEDELILEEANEWRPFEQLLKTTGPISEADLYFNSKNILSSKQWRAWTSPVMLLFRGTKKATGTFENELALALGNVDKNKRSSSSGDSTDWLDELGRATSLLQAFSRRELPQKTFLIEQMLQWRQRKYKVTIEAPQPLPNFFEEDKAKKLNWKVNIPGASKLRLEWSSRSRLDPSTASAFSLKANGGTFFGRNGLPPPIESVSGCDLEIGVSVFQSYEPLNLMRVSIADEVNTFGYALPATNDSGEAVFAYVDRSGEARLGCQSCRNNAVGPGPCCQNLRKPENCEGRTVSPFPTRGSWSCSLCAPLPAPCLACALFPQSAAFGYVRARDRDSFSQPALFEAFLKKTLVPRMPVQVDGKKRRFVRFIEDEAVTEAFDGSGDDQIHPIVDLSLIPRERINGDDKLMINQITDSMNGLNASSNNVFTVPSPASPDMVRGATFAINDIGPDISISNNGLSVTRLRSVGWGTQRMSRYLDPSCGVVTITFKIDRNTSNHLFFGVVAPSFTDWSRRLMEPGAWSIRRDGSTHADGRERSSASADARLITGESLTMIVDMASEIRSVTFLRNGIFLGKLQGLPPRVVPAVSFGGSNQVVTIQSFLIGGVDVPNRKQSFGFEVVVIPEFDKTDEGELQEYAKAMMKWTVKQDRTLVNFIDQICAEKKLTLSILIRTSWDELIQSSSRYILLDTLVQEGFSMNDIGQRYEWLRTLNASVAKALPLMELSFEDGTDNAIVDHLSECSHLLFHALKVPMWEDALECTRTEEGQFEVMLDYGRALAHRHLVDTHGRFSVFGQAFRAMNSMPPSRLRMRGQLYRATLRGMRAHDDGGPYRQSFQTYCAELLSTPGLGLFLPCANRINDIHDNRDKWLPNPGAKSAVQLAMFEFVGKLMGIALRNHEYLDLRLPSLVWKWLVNKKPNLDDLRAVDLLFVNMIQTLAQMPEDDLDTWGDDIVTNMGKGNVPHGLNFTIYTLDGRLCELLPDGEHRLVSFAQDRSEYVRLATEFKLNEFNEQLEAIRRGLATVVPQRMLTLFTWEELELLVCGRPKIDLTLLKDMTVYMGCSENDPHIQAFWRVLQSFSEESRSLYLRFVWGRSRLPASRGSWGEAPHKISLFDAPSRHSAPVNPDTLLPRSHTCYFSLDLPRYSSEDVLRQKLLFAIENCTEIDADQTTTGNRSAALGFDLEPLDQQDLENGMTEATTPTANADYLASLGGADERRPSQSSFGSDFEDVDEDVVEAEIEVFARLGHDLEAVNVFEFARPIDFGEDD